MKKTYNLILGLIIIVLAGILVYRLFILKPEEKDAVQQETSDSDAAGAPLTSGREVQIPDIQAVSEWREENRTGNSAESGLMKSWPKNGPDLIWLNTELPKGHSSPSFGSGTIYLTGNEGENDVLVALDAAGKVKWKTIYGRAWTKSNPESRCTPTVEGNRVYVSSGFGDLVCIDGIAGEIVWSLKASELFRGTYGDWGIAESLIVDADKVYFTPGGPETTIIAISKNSGEAAWKSQSINESPAYVSPILIEYAGKKIIINVLQKNIVAVDASDGTILWKIDHTKALDTKESLKVWPDAPHTKCVTPLYHEGSIYVTGGYDHGSMMIKMNENGSNATVTWTETLLDVHHGGVVMLDGYIYGANWISNAKGNWCCLDWTTGKKMYEEGWKSKGSIISADGMLYLYDERTGFVGLVKPNPSEFELVSSFRVTKGSGPYWAHPVINNGNLYLRHGEALMVYDIKAK